MGDMMLHLVTKRQKTEITSDFAECIIKGLHYIENEKGWKSRMINYEGADCDILLLDVPEKEAEERREYVVLITEKIIHALADEKPKYKNNMFWDRHIYRYEKAE